MHLQINVDFFLYEVRRREICIQLHNFLNSAPDGEDYRVCDQQIFFLCECV